ncbi:MAG: GNAT family N-acetyltransferase [Nevskia sp.]
MSEDAQTLSSSVIVCETRRLILRRVEPTDAAFIVELLNDADFLRFIGDKNVRTLDDARGYIENGPRASYAQHGFGLWLVHGKDVGLPIGLCGLVKRDTLDDVDLGFAFLPAWRGRGYAFEAAAATLAHGRDAFGLRRIVAIASPDNEPSAALLRRVGMRDAGCVTLSGDTQSLSFFIIDLPAGHD